MPAGGLPASYVRSHVSLPGTERAAPTGIGILSRHSFTATQTVHYAGGGSGSDLLDRTSEESRYQSNRYSVAIAEIGSGSESLTIATTHFPWSDDAQTRDFQRTACDSLLRLLEGRSLVLAGDFNAPRGREIFERLAARWTDNIPSTVTSSLDPFLHRAAPLALMVDGIFSTPDYLVSDVKLHQGVSDHCAITALISKRSTMAG